MDEAFKTRGITADMLDEAMMDEILSGDSEDSSVVECRTLGWLCNSKITNLLVAGGLALGGAAGCSKESKDPPELNKALYGCLGKEGAKGFSEARDKVEKRCKAYRKEWVIERKDLNLRDPQLQQDGLKACKKYDDFLVSRKDDADKVRKNTSPDHEDGKRGKCRQLVQKLFILIKNNKKDNLDVLERTY